jgi:hypothetical protein
LIAGPRHLAVVLQEFVEHYNTHRPHRSLDQHPPTGRTPPPSGAIIRPLRRDRLGGLVHEYVHVAWHDRVLGTHTYSTDACHAASTMSAIWSLAGGRGLGLGFDGGRTDSIGFKLIQPHRTAAVQAPDKIAWIDRTLDAA